MADCTISTGMHTSDYNRTRLRATRFDANTGQSRARATHRQRISKRKHHLEDDNCEVHTVLTQREGWVTPTNALGQDLHMRAHTRVHAKGRIPHNVRRSVLYFLQYGTPGVRDAQTHPL
jgi:hypothetical protein